VGVAHSIRRIIEALVRGRTASVENCADQLTSSSRLFFTEPELLVSDRHCTLDLVILYFRRVN